MSDEARAELVDAVKSGSIVNATEFAQAFAARHGLKAQSVRPAISRIRRELGLLERSHGERLASQGPTGQRKPATSDYQSGRAQRGEQMNAMTILSAADVSDLRFARLGAAALVRYEADEDFRRAVDRQRPELEDVYRQLNELRERMADLPREELEELVRFTASTLFEAG
jgi:hypothetical protein